MCDRRTEGAPKYMLWKSRGCISLALFFLVDFKCLQNRKNERAKDLVGLVPGTEYGVKYAMPHFWG